MTKALFCSMTFLLALPSLQVPLRAQCPSLIWADEFSGTAVDPNRWQMQLGNGCNIGLCGWGNNELQSYRAENATVSDGTLEITARREQADGRQYTSARMRTINRGDWTFGRFEARIKLPSAQGAWPAFWMLSTDEVYGSWPRSGEIDIMESRGQSSQVASGAIHFGQLIPNNRVTGGSVTFTEPLSDDFHVYAIEWERDEIRWFLDGVPYARRVPTDLRGNPWPFDQRFHLLLNLAVGGNFPGPADPADYPSVMEVDYVRVYDGSVPHLAGEVAPSIFSNGVEYRVVNGREAVDFRWEVPASARLASGQGTSAIQVDWEQEGGVIGVEFDSACGPQRLELPAVIRSPDVVEAVIENFEEARGLERLFSAGEYAPEVENPAPSGINPSARVARYRRNPGEKFDTLLFRTSAFPDVTGYVDQRRRLYLDLYTDAPPGTEVILQFEADNRTSATNYPMGRHSTYTARTARQNEWERLEFDLSARLDGGTAHTAIDNLVILFDSGWNTGDTYYFDNLSSALVDAEPPTAPSNLRLLASDESSLSVAWDASTDNLGIDDYLVFANGQPAGATSDTAFDLTELESGTGYEVTVRARDLAGNRSAPAPSLQVVTPGGNLVANGDFEDGALNPWVGAILTTDRVHSGAFAARIGEAGLSQQIGGLRPDTEYRLSAWLAAGEGASIQVGVDGFGGSFVSPAFTAGEFQRVSMIFRTASNATSARILVRVQAVRQRRSWTLRRSPTGFADDFELTRVRD